jgi:hypothetical protein
VLVSRLFELLANIEHKMAAVQEPQTTQVSLGNGSRKEDSSKPGKAEQYLVNEAAAEFVLPIKERPANVVNLPLLHLNSIKSYHIPYVI